MEMNTIELYEHAHFKGEKKTLHIFNYAPNLIKKLTDWDHASVGSVKFRLSKGIAVTLSEQCDLATRPPCLTNLGLTYDLYGYGAIKCMKNHAITPQVTGFFYRKYDPELGYIKFYERPNGEGHCTTLFISDWWNGKENRLINIAGWHIKGNVSSYETKGLRSQTEIALFPATDGTGGSFRIRGVDQKENDIQEFGRRFSAFKAKLNTPARTHIKPIDTKLGEHISEHTLVEKTAISNPTHESVTHEVDFSIEEKNTLAVTTAENILMSDIVTVEVSLPLPKAGINICNLFTVETEHSFSKRITKEAQKKISIGRTLEIPTQVSIGAQAVTSVGEVYAAETVFEVTNYYQEKYDGTALDPVTGLYYELLTVKGTLGGRFYSDSTIQISSIDTQAA